MRTNEEVLVSVLAELNAAINNNLAHQSAQDGWTEAQKANWKGQYHGLKHAVGVIGLELIKCKEEK